MLEKQYIKFQNTISLDDYLLLLIELHGSWAFNKLNIQNDTEEGFDFLCNVLNVRVKFGPIVKREEYLDKLLSLVRSCFIDRKYGRFKY